MKKTIILILGLIFSFMIFNTNSYSEEITKGQYLLEYQEYKDITPENIKKIKIIRYTEAGVSEKVIKDKKSIKDTYNYLKKIKIDSKTNFSCTDNTTIYHFTLNDNSQKYIEKECSWVIINRQNYKIKIEKE